MVMFRHMVRGYAADDRARAFVTELAVESLAVSAEPDEKYAAVVLARSNDSAVGFQHIEMSTLGAYSSLCRSSPASGSEAGAVMFTDSRALVTSVSNRAPLTSKCR